MKGSENSGQRKKQAAEFSEGKGQRKAAKFSEKNGQRKAAKFSEKNGQRKTAKFSEKKGSEIQRKKRAAKGSGIQRKKTGSGILKNSNAHNDYLCCPSPPTNAQMPAGLSCSLDSRQECGDHANRLHSTFCILR